MEWATGKRRPALRVQRRSDVAAADLEEMRDIPFLDGAADARRRPAVAAGAGRTVLGEEVTGDITGLDAGRAEGGQEIGVDIGAGAFGQPAGQVRHMVEAVGELGRRVAVGEPIRDAAGDADRAGQRVALPRERLRIFGHEVGRGAGVARRVRGGTSVPDRRPAPPR
jgi:hypothetical protein